MDLQMGKRTGELPCVLRTRDLPLTLAALQQEGGRAGKMHGQAAGNRKGGRKGREQLLHAHSNFAADS